MPPKKKKEDGDDKKREKKAGKKSSGGPPMPEQLNEQSKEYYLAQIRDLESRIDKYQKLCDELEVKNGEFRSKFDQMEENKKDIVAFIKKKLDEKIDEISDLNDHLIGLQQSKDQDREMFEQQLQQLRTEYRETKDQLTAENMMLSGKLASLEEFRIQREELMAQTAKLESDLLEQANAHREEIYDLEKKQVIDKDRLKKEMVTRVNQVAAEFRKASNRQMAETTKRTIRENVAISSQLSKMSDKVTDLISSNNSLKDHDRQQRQQIELFQSIEAELTKKNLSNQKIIKMLTEKCQALEYELEMSKSVETDHSAVDAEVAELRLLLEKTREEMTALAKKNHELEQQLNAAQNMLDEKTRARKKLERVLENAATALKDAVSPSLDEDCANSIADLTSKRTVMLENLLILLNNAAELGIGPSPSDFRSNKSYTSKTRNPGVESFATEMSTVGPIPAHYQVGDLGLVPRAEPTSRVSRSSDGHRHTSSNLGRTTAGRSSSTQTPSAAKAAFLVEMQGRNAQSSAEFRRSVSTSKVLPAISNTLPVKPIPGQAY